MYRNKDRVEMSTILTKPVLLWLFLSMAHAWWDAWFGIELFDRSKTDFRGQHFLGGLISPIWLIIFLIIFDFDLSSHNLGWLLIGLAIAGGGCNLLRHIYWRITKVRLVNSERVEWWFKVYITKKQMNLTNLTILTAGIVLVTVS